MPYFCIYSIMKLKFVGITMIIRLYDFFFMMLPPLPSFLIAANGEGMSWFLNDNSKLQWYVCTLHRVVDDLISHWGWQAELHTGSLPQIQSTALRGEKLHRVFHYVLDNLVNVMNGYCLPDPFFSNRVWITSLWEGMYK